MDELAQRRLTKDPQVMEKPLADGSLVLFHPERRELLTVNALAAFIWASSDGQRSVAALVDEIGAMFPEQDEVERDIRDLVQTLAAKGFVTLSDLPGSAKVYAAESEMPLPDSQME